MQTRDCSWWVGFVALAGMTWAVGLGFSTPGDKREREGSQGEAVTFRLRQRLSEGGRVPKGALQRAMDQKRTMEMGDAIDPAAWEWMGPDNVGGRVRGIVINPTNPSMMWAGAATGGIWRTEDGGEHWMPQGDLLASLSISKMHGVTTGGGQFVLYASTGEGAGHVDGTMNTGAIRGAGLFRSTNLGATWTLVEGSNEENFTYINDFYVPINDPNGILLATDSGLYRGGGGGGFAVLNVSQFFEIKQDAVNPQRLYAAGAGFIIISSDGGVTFSDVADPVSA